MLLISEMLVSNCVLYSSPAWFYEARQRKAARASCTFELLESLEDAGSVGGVASLLLVGGLGLCVACNGVNGRGSIDSSWVYLRRTKVVEKARRAMAAGAARLAAAMAERWTNMARAVGWSGEVGVGGAGGCELTLSISCESNELGSWRITQRKCPP